jgi:hypothetical protein
MPTVPMQDAPGVAPQEAPQVQQRAPFRMMQMAEIGPGEQMRLGQGLEQAGNSIGNIAIDQQQQVNEAAVKTADAALQSHITDVLYNPDSGYTNQRGQSAVTGAPTAIQSLQDGAQGIVNGIDNPAQRQMFQATADARIAAATRQVQEHAGQQAGVYAMESSKLRQQAASDQAIQSYNPMPGANNDLFTQAVATQHLELEHQAAQLGINDPDARADYVRNGMVPTYTALVNHLLENNQTKAAQTAFASIRDQLPAAVQDKLQGFLDSAGTKDDALSTAIDVKAKYPGNIDAQEKYLDDQFKSGALQSDVHDLALQKLRADSAQQRSEQSENDKSVLGRIWAAKQQNPNLAITDLSSSDYAYITQRGLGPHVDSILSSGPVIDDAQLYNDLAHQAVDPDSREKFAQTNLMLYRGQLTSAHFDQIQRMQLGIDKGDAKQMQADKLVHDTVGGIKANMAAAGFTMTPKAGSPEAADLAHFETSLRDSLVAAQQEKQGPLTQQEARDIALGQMKDQALENSYFWIFPKGGFLGDMIDDLTPNTTLPAYKMTPEQRAADWVIPEKDEADITSALQKAGMPATKAAIQAVYKRAQGVRQ